MPFSSSSKGLQGGVVLLAWASSFAAHARAAPCEEVSESVVVTGSSAIKPLLAELGQLLEVPTSETVGATRVYYKGAGSCTGIEAMLDPESFQPETLQYWTASGTEIECELDPTDSTAARIGVSDVFPATCTNLPNGLPSNVADFLGPVQVMTFVVPQASTQTNISAEAAYYVYGFGSASGVTPWNDPDFIFQRNDQSGTQRMVSAAIGVGASRWKGTETSGTGDLLQRLLASNGDGAERTIGILSASSAQDNRSTLTTLAYQDVGGECAVLPDRTPLSSEKENVRNGRYPIWGPLHLLANVDSNRRPTSQSVESVISFLLGTAQPIPGLDLIQLQAERHIIPQCAMGVSRSYEMGPLSPAAPAQPCGCYYEAVANGSSSCSACAANRDCEASEICSYGYCETLQ